MTKLKFTTTNIFTKANYTIFIIRIFFVVQSQARKNREKMGKIKRRKHTIITIIFLCKKQYYYYYYY